MQAPRQTWLTSLAVSCIYLYRNTLSHILLDSCRFYPTCSAYAIEAIERHGFIQGMWRAIRRVLRCRPFSRWGIDPVR